MCLIAFLQSLSNAQEFMHVAPNSWVIHQLITNNTLFVDDEGSPCRNALLFHQHII